MMRDGATDTSTQTQIEKYEINYVYTKYVACWKMTTLFLFIFQDDYPVSGNKCLILLWICFIVAVQNIMSIKRHCTCINHWACCS